MNLKIRRPRLWLAAAVVTFLIGVTISIALRTKSSQTPQPSHNEVRLIIPKAGWEPIFFKTINSLTGLTAQTELRKISMGEGEHEARIWWGFGLSPLEGISLRYSGGRWSAIHVKADNYYEPTKATREELKPPRSGWETTWQRLVDAGILTLVDESEVNCREPGLDGISVVVETNIDRTYKTYKYSNPMLEKCSQAKQVVKITDTISEEFEWTRTETTPPPDKRLQQTRR